MTKRDFKALERKLARGIPLPMAAELVGIPLDEAQAWRAKRREGGEEAGEDQLTLFSDEALRTGLNTLKRAIREKNRKVLHRETDDDSNRIETKEQVLDVDAAKALLRAGIEVRKILERRAAPKRKADAAGDVAKDLFDLMGPWKIKDPDSRA